MRTDPDRYTLSLLAIQKWRQQKPIHQNFKLLTLFTIAIGSFIAFSAICLAPKTNIRGKNIFIKTKKQTFDRILLDFLFLWSKSIILLIWADILLITGGGRSLQFVLRMIYIMLKKIFGFYLVSVLSTIIFCLCF